MIILIEPIFFFFCFFKFFNKFSIILDIYDIPYKKLHEKKISLAGGVYLFICIYAYLIVAIILEANNMSIFLK